MTPISDDVRPGAATPAPAGRDVAAGTAFLADTAIAELAGAVEDLAGRFALEPLLQRILRRAVGLLGGAAGSICTVDEKAGTYRKEADLGVLCRQGSVFPLAEGTTGAVVARRGPVVFERYSDVPGGHLTARERDRMHATVAVPIEWSGAIIGACVVFSADPQKRWTQRDVDLLQLFAGHAAVALANARLHAEAAERSRRQAVEAGRERVVLEVHGTLVRTLGAALEHLDALGPVAASELERAHLEAVACATRSALAETRRTVLDSGPAALGRGLAEALEQELAWLRATTRIETDLVVTGDPSGIDDEVALAALHAVQEALANVVAHSGAAQVRVGLLCLEHGVTVLVSDNGRGFDTAAISHDGLDRAVRLVERAGGSVSVETALSGGTRLRIELPNRPTPAAAGSGRPAVRVLIVDARPLVRAGTSRLLASAQPEIVVVGEASDADAAVRMAHKLDPDLVLIGLGDEAPGLAVVEAVLSAAPALTVLAVCGSRISAAGQARLARRGCGVVGLAVDRVELARVVAAAAAGEIVLAAEVADAVPGVLRSLIAFTPREREVVDLVARGIPDKQVARQLAISVKTVEKHVGAALRKAGLPNRTALANRLAHGSIGSDHAQT